MPAGDDIPIQIVDENDQPIASASIEEARKKNLIHRVARVMAEDGNGNVLLQRRNEVQETFPNCWDPTAAGHVDAEETYEQAAIRELKEEVGIEGYGLEEVGYYRSNALYEGMHLNRFNKIFKITIPKDTSIIIQEEEVGGVQWFSTRELLDLVVYHPDKISDGLKGFVENYYSK